MSKYDDAITRIQIHQERHFADEPRAVMITKAFDLAIEALREAAEREKGCEYCASALAPLYEISTNGNPSFKLFEPPFCPMCGKRLTKEPDA